MMRGMVGLMVLLASAASAVPAPPRDRAGPSTLAAVIGDRPVAAPVDCIDPRQIRSTQIIDGTAIVYDMGGRLYVNRPTTGAGSLRRDDVIVSRIDGGELCRIDTITLVDAVTRMQRGFVVLAAFDVYGPRR